MTADVYWQLVEEHDGVAGIEPVEPLIPDPSDPSGRDKILNPNPVYKYNFRDGTYILGHVGKTENDFVVVDWGNVRTVTEARRKEKEAKEAKDAQQQEAAKNRVVLPTGIKRRGTAGMDRKAMAAYEQELLNALDREDITPGNRTAINDELNRIINDMRVLGTAEAKKGPPNTIFWVDLPNGEKLAKGAFDGQGDYRDLTDKESAQVTAAYGYGTGAGGAGAGGGGAGGVGGGGSAGRARSPSEIALDEARARTEDAQARYYDARARGDDVTQEERDLKKAEADLRRAETDYRKTQTETEKVKTEAEKKKLLPQQVQAFQERAELLKTIEDMLNKDQMTIAEAAAYLDLYDQNVHAKLKGTTPFDIEKEKRRKKEWEAGQAKDMLNQRLVSATSMANSLMGGFMQGLPYLGAAPGAGGLKFNPFELAKGFTQDVQGGQQSSDLAKALNMGIEGPQVLERGIMGQDTDSAAALADMLSRGMAGAQAGRNVQPQGTGPSGHSPLMGPIPPDMPPDVAEILRGLIGASGIGPGAVAGLGRR